LGRNGVADVKSLYNIGDVDKTGGSAPNNLITLCETCHNKHHKGEIKLKAKRGASLKDAAFMGIMRWAFYEKLKELYPSVSLTYGYITKNTRISNDLEKSHRVDARCISGNVNAKPIQTWYNQKHVRKNNRSLYKANQLKGGKRKANKAPYTVHGFRLFDKVLYAGTECFVFGRRSSGYFDLRLLDGSSVHKSASHKKLRLLEMGSTLLTERRSKEIQGNCVTAILPLTPTATSHPKHNLTPHRGEVIGGKVSGFLA